jgi:hypothetical protein
LEYNGEPEVPPSINIAVPVNLRNPLEPVTSLGNKIGSYLVELPLQGDGASRLQIICLHMQRNKRLPEPHLTHTISQIFSHMPKRLTNMVFKGFSQQASAVLTNVRGPTKQISFLGRPVRTLAGFVPPPIGIAIGVAVGSYADDLALTFNVDENIIPDPSLLMQFFLDEYEDLKQQAKSKPPLDSSNESSSGSTSASDINNIE